MRKENVKYCKSITQFGKTKIINLVNGRISRKELTLSGTSSVWNDHFFPILD